MCCVQKKYRFFSFLLRQTAASVLGKTTFFKFQSFQQPLSKKNLHPHPVNKVPAKMAPLHPDITGVIIPSEIHLYFPAIYTGYACPSMYFPIGSDGTDPPWWCFFGLPGFHTPGISRLKPITKTIQGITAPRTKGEGPGENFVSKNSMGGIFSFSELKRKTLVKFFLFFCERSSTLEFYSYIRFIFKHGLKLHSLKVALALRKPSPKRKENVFQALPLGCPPPCD